MEFANTVTVHRVGDSECSACYLRPDYCGVSGCDGIVHTEDDGYTVSFRCDTCGKKGEEANEFN